VETGCLAPEKPVVQVIAPDNSGYSGIFSAQFVRCNSFGESIMKMKILNYLLCFAVMGTGMSVASALETEDALPGAENLLPETPLGVRQARVERMMRDLEKKFTALAQVLEKTEKAQADRLVAAFQESKKLLLEDRMAKITNLLDDAKLEAAGENQQEVIGDLRKLMELLLTEEDETEKIRKEIAALEQLQKDLAKMLNAEQELLDENESITDQDETLSALEKQINQVKDLIKREEAVEKAAEAAKEKGLDALDEVADKQRDVRKDTETLAKEMSEQDDAKKPGAKEMTKAGEQQKSAEKAFGNGQQQAGQKSAQESIAQMKKALGELEKKQQEVAGKKPEDIEKTGEKQEDLAKQMDDLNKQEQEKPSSDSEAMQQAQQDMKSAQQNMSKAGKKMAGKQGKQGQQDQKEAKEDLKKAMAQVQERLDELKEKAPNDKAEQLIAMFEAMLKEQESVSADTRVLNEKKQKEEGRSARAEKLASKKLSNKEEDLSEEAGTASDLIKEDGSSVVVARVVANMQKDLVLVTTWLGEQNTGPIAQEMQYEIELTLKELIDAMKQNQQSEQPPPPSDKPPGEGECKPKLVPTSAELKLLRSHQMRVNRMTKLVAKAEATGALDPQMLERLSGLTDFQAEILEMAQEMTRQMQQQQ
jgi:hypothetical protein